MPSRAHFREALEMLRIDVDGLGAMAQEATAGALKALLRDDRSIAHDVVAGDDPLDARFIALEERAYCLVAAQAPVATDLRFLMSALRVMADFEKTGDRAVGIAKTVLAEWERESASIRLLGRMGDLAMIQLRSARGAWVTQDLATASELKRRDDVLDHCYRRLVAHLLAQDGSGASSLVLHAHAAGRNLERIADHAVMIGERVTYLVTGDPSALAAEIS
jgi:phosphate transport system protein